MAKLVNVNRVSDWMVSFEMESGSKTDTLKLECSDNVSIDKNTGYVDGCWGEIKTSGKTLKFAQSGHKFKFSANVNGEFVFFGKTYNTNNLASPDSGNKPKDKDTSESKSEPFDIKAFLPETESYYRNNVENFQTSRWYEELPELGASVEERKKLATLQYYLRVDGKVDLSKISEEVSPYNPDNVNRVIELMPKSKFETYFPNTVNMNEKNGFIPGKVFSYLNFLKAVAVMPGYAGDYSGFPEEFKTELMKNPKVVAKKFLATTLAHAVQETSGSGVDGCSFERKIRGTFDYIAEVGAPEMPDASGVFSNSGRLYPLTKGNKYYGRGAKQLSYPQNYANTSLLLYGDLRLVKYPDLIESESCLAFLTAITYALIPKVKKPSLAETMDGSWHEALMHADVKAENRDAYENYVKTYDRDFPLTVILVNGGVEGGNDTKNRNQSKIRIDAYNHLSTSDDLLDPAVTYEVESGDGYDSVSGMFDSSLYIAENQWFSSPLFERPYYYDVHQNRLQSWDNGIQIFGGLPIKQLY